MIVVWQTIGWLLALLFALFATSMLLTHNWQAAVVMFILILLCLPPVSARLKDRHDFSLHWAMRLVLIVVLMVVFSRLFWGATRTSIYHTPEIETQFEAIYAQKMSEWPVPYEDVYLNTQYGKVYVIVSGPEDAPPMLLLHASGAASWSWKHNVAALNRHYRTYAVDTIGDVGRSAYADINRPMESKQDQAALYREIMDQLGIDKAYVVGASEGGFIGSNIALYAPERVIKLACLGPMGYSGTAGAIVRLTLSQLFPLKPVLNATFVWAFSATPMLVQEYAEWFPLLMSGAAPVKVPPTQFSATERQNMRVPIMFVFGVRDNLVGDPIAARALVQDIPNVRAEIVPAGHLMGAEMPEHINGYLFDFFEAE